jgi:3-oxosteroid 1-dehydrogenase
MSYVIRRQVVVVGSGAAGMAAAVAAARGGAHVTVLEAADHIGGTTTYSGSGSWVPNNPWARAAGIDDSAADALRYLRSLGAHGDWNEALCATYVEHGARALRAIQDSTVLSWHILREFPDYHSEFDGGRRQGRSLEIDPVQLPREITSTIRSNPYAPPPVTTDEEGMGGIDAGEIERRRRENVVVKGVGLIGGLRLALEQLGGRIRTGARVEQLLTSGGRVVGARAGGEELDGRVVIASGGFERDSALVRTFLRGPMLAPASPPSNRGDGLRLGMSIGAALGNMSEAWWCPAMSVPGETDAGEPFFRMLFRDRAKPGGLIVDSHGQRFANESANYNDFGRSLHAFDPVDYTFPRVPSWLIIDRSRRAERLGPLEPADADPEWLVCAPTVRQLAVAIDVPAQSLEASVERYNQHASRGVDIDFGRGSYAWDWYSSGKLDAAAQLRPLCEPPYYALRVLPGCLGTKGGLRIDGNARVLRADGGGPIEGLYAAGNAAANPFGYAYPGGGATVGPALVFGWLAGETAAAA